MIVKLSNGSITAEIETVGAELRSLKAADGTEYMWCRDGKFWNRCSPTLFPSIGVVKEGKADFGFATTEMPKHGIVRDAEYEVVKNDDASVTLRTAKTEETYKYYPFDFALEITYSLTDNGIRTAWKVSNMGDTKMPFMIGGHPAFNIPLAEGEVAEDYDFKFNAKTDFVSLRIGKDGLINDETMEIGKNTDTIPFDYSLFDGDALVFENYPYTSCTLVSRKSGKGVKVDFKGFPYLGIWSPTGARAPFVCIEPWYGINSHISETTRFNAKKGMNFVEKGEEFNTEYTVTLL